MGIVVYRAYVPKYRLAGDLVPWNGLRLHEGEKAVANFDGDTITIGAKAVFDCLSSIDPKQFEGLYFALTTPPYKEK